MSHARTPEHLADDIRAALATAEVEADITVLETGVVNVQCSDEQGVSRVTEVFDGEWDTGIIPGLMTMTLMFGNVRVVAWCESTPAARDDIAGAVR